VEQPGVVDGPRPTFVGRLASFGERAAVVCDGATTTYTELAVRVAGVAAELGPARRLVQVCAGNDLGSLVGYLGALAGGHVVLLGGPDPEASRAASAAVDPDVIVHDAGTQFDERRPGTRHELHPDLALLLSTSGTTGAAKLVRLAHRNLDANAAAIADYLGITPADRAVTTLPMHYCYGLSVVNSHLLSGATLLLTDLSVVDRCFWDLCRREGATSFAGVPYTFDLLEHSGFADLTLPSLRYITQAGGRLAPERVRSYAELGRRQGWDLVVMYGQTEATARMAYLPPELATVHPEAIGRPIPGGSFELRPIAGAAPGSGELIYRGPNVMLGYAETPADLGLGATVGELATGDVAREVGDGIYAIVGRVSRFVKPFGLRVDLDQVERLLDADGIPAIVTGDDAGLVVGVPAGAAAERVVELVRRRCGLPASAVVVVAPDPMPRLPNGKPDHATLLTLGRTAESRPPAGSSAAGDDLTGRLCGVYATVLRRAEVRDTDTFVGLGGDSLSYVEVSARLEDELGALPAAWHLMPIAELATRRRVRTRVARIETNVVLRALAIVLVVGNHTDTWRLLGGAHVLLAIAGYNFARFTLQSGRQALGIARIAIPAVCWIGLVAAFRDDFSLAHALLVNAQLGEVGNRWAYWYVEALVQLLVPLALLFAIPVVRSMERRRGLEVAVAVLAVGIVLRLHLVGPGPAEPHFYRAHEVLWLFAAGWVALKATAVWQRIALSVVVVAMLPGFFGEGQREAVVGVGVLLLVWVPQLSVPRVAVPVISRLAAASLYIYLTHWQVYPTLVDRVGSVPALAVSVGVGLAVAALVLPALAAGEAWVTAVRRARTPAGLRRPGPLAWRRDATEPVRTG
jgi:acyl-CoA synthetase (AMP-forming)/AMP-acid ligase II